MDSKNKIISKNLIKDLLIINALKNTDRENTKTAREIIKEVETILHKLFPNEFPEPDIESLMNTNKPVPPTVSRIVNDMNLLPELYKIETYRDKKLGYYNANEGKDFLFTPAEFALIALALYRTPSVSTEETEMIIKKFKGLIGITGDMFSYAILEKQIKVWQGIRRKTHRVIMPIISELLKAIIEEHQVTFNLYERSFKYKDEEVPLQTRQKKRKTRETIVNNFRVSPYFLAWEEDECYLIAYSHYPNYDMPTGQQLTHFKISLITNLKILEEDTETLRRMNFYARYAMEPHTRYTDQDTRNRLAEIRKLLSKDTQRTEFRNFSLDRYMREHIYMVTNNSPTVDVRIEFDENFLETVLTQLTLKQIVEKSVINDKKFQTIMTVQDNDGLYQWLMRYSDKVTVIEPEHVCNELRKRLKKALKNLKRGFL